jgi:hypothetical protein
LRGEGRVGNVPMYIHICGKNCLKGDGATLMVAGSLSHAANSNSLHVCIPPKAAHQLPSNQKRL